MSNERLDIELRAVKPDEMEAFLQADSRASGGHASAEYIRRVKAGLEQERTLGAFDNGSIVGGTRALTLQMAVPGGRLPAAGVAHVFVQPTHRRQGVLTRMMERQLRDIHEKGEPLAALYCSESIIYGRFGYGMSTFNEKWTIDRRHTAFAHAPDQRGRVAFVEEDEARKLFPGVYKRVWVARPGMIKRSAKWWDQIVAVPDEDRPASGNFFHAVYESGGRTDGYVVYRVDQTPGDYKLVVRELIAATDEAYGALWRFCFGVDLMTSIEAWTRPPDDPLLWMLADPRRLKRSPSDALWLRLVDVPGALSGRRYALEGRLVLEVRDSFCPWNEGRVELFGGPAGAECQPTQLAPDLVLSAADLAAVFLGAAKFRTLSHAGRVEAQTRDAVGRADAMFATAVQPWCADFF